MAKGSCDQKLTGCCAAERLALSAFVVALLTQMICMHWYLIAARF